MPPPVDRALWVGTAMFGLGMASMFPCMMSLVEEFIDLTGRTASIIVVGAALGEMLIPMTVGALFGSKGPRSFPPAVLAFCFLSIAAFVTFFVISKVGRAAHLAALASRGINPHEGHPGGAEMKGTAANDDNDDDQ